MGTWQKESRAPPRGVRFTGLDPRACIHNKALGDSETHSSIETSIWQFWILPLLEGTFVFEGWCWIIRLQSNLGAGCTTACCRPHPAPRDPGGAEPGGQLAPDKVGRPLAWVIRCCFWLKASFCPNSDRVDSALPLSRI